MDEKFGSKLFPRLWEQEIHFPWVCISVKHGLILFLVFLCWFGTTDLGVAVQGKARWDLLSWIPGF